jgi:hypothetical protein
MRDVENSFSKSNSHSIQLADILFLVSLVMMPGLWIMTRTSAVEQQSAQVMPYKVVAEAERQLYLTPRGLYSQADMEANDGLTPSQKFAGFQAEHDFSPQAGEALCPITRTKANPECEWIIGGRRYRFCCPPCIDEFVELAKNRPESIMPPESFVQSSQLP